MGDLTFGKSFNMVKDGSPNATLKRMNTAKPFLGIFTCVPWLFNLVQNLPIVGGKGHALLKLCKNQIDERKKVYKTSYFPPAFDVC